jgi:hypothetical protein
VAAAGPPVFYYSFQVYPEVLSGLALATSLIVLLSSPGIWGAAAAALLASALPWLHLRMAPAAAALGTVALLRLRGRGLAGFLAVSAVMAAAFLAYHHAIFGDPSPLALYGGGLPRGVRRASLPAGLGGLFLDRSFGLLPYAPVFLAALGGIPLLFRRSWREALPCALVGIAIVAPVATWRAWFGGFSPPARFLVPLVPVLGACLALRAGARPRGLARWRGAALVWGFALTLLMVVRPSETLLLNVKEEAPRALAALTDEGFVERYLPNFTSAEPADRRVCLVWAAALLLLLALDQLALRREAVDRLFGSPGLSIGLLLLIGGTIDLWARS